jgi:EAL domain-containing protein (putative c-di-GMP-specific phosphodiesterase class I)
MDHVMRHTLNVTVDDTRTRQELDRVLGARAVSSVYQPVADLASGQTVGYEALARGPAGSRLRSPDALIGAARRSGRLPELDWLCRAVACRGALESDLPAGSMLFVNVEPASSRTACPADLRDVIRAAVDRFRVVAEVTERSVASDPAGLIGTLDQLRREGHRVALDDLGADAATQAMMPLLRPDVVKIDRTVIQAPQRAAAAGIIDAARSHSIRTGALVLAEGIETDEHLDVARSIGATLGQGWLYGRPADLPVVRRRPADGAAWRRLAGVGRPAMRRMPDIELPSLPAGPPAGSTPFELARAEHGVERATRRRLLALSRGLEDRGVHAAEPTVLLTTFQHARHFDLATRRRYTGIAANGILTAVIAEGIEPEPAPGIVGVALDPDEPLNREWTVIVVASQFVGGLFARQHGHASGSFDVVTTSDWDVVLAAADVLLRRLGPRPEAG